ncbi:MAG: hypothetical protein ABSG56_04225 [Bryobacteraceae bacterium]
MRLVFADTLYWGAALNPRDQYRAQVIAAREALGEIHLVTTGEVLTGLLAVHKILTDQRVTVHPPTARATVLWIAYP